MHDLISLTQWPSMPAPLSSTQPGETWVWGDFVLTLQTHPKKVADAMHQIAGTRQTGPSPIDYPYAVTVYYRKDRNPHGPSSRPILVVGIEKMNNAAAAAMLRAQGIDPSELGMDGDSPLVLGLFTAASRFNLGSYDGPTDIDSIRDQLFSIVGDHVHPVGEPVKIGPISAIHGHPNTGWPALQQKKGGCAGVLALLTLLLIIGFAICYIAAGRTKANQALEPTAGPDCRRSSNLTPKSTADSMLTPAPAVGSV